MRCDRVALRLTGAIGGRVKKFPKTIAEQLAPFDPQRIHAAHRLAAQALERYYVRLRTEPLAIDKWFSLQARAPDRGGNILPAVRQLMQHPDFNQRNPNRARSLLFSYCAGNPAGFHRADGAGYAFWADRVLEIDAFNPQVAARLARALDAWARLAFTDFLLHSDTLARALDAWARLAQHYREAVRAAIARVAAAPKLSNDVREVVTRALEGASSGRC